MLQFLCFAQNRIIVKIIPVYMYVHLEMIQFHSFEKKKTKTKLKYQFELHIICYFITGSNSVIGLTRRRSVSITEDGAVCKN